MSEEAEKIVFETEDGEEIGFYVLEQTRIKGKNYLLVADEDEEEANALILKEKESGQEAESIYEMVEDEEELKVIAKVFEEILDDIDIETH